MSNIILANCTSTLNRIAIIENERLTGLNIERPTERGQVGSIFKGRVTNIVPGIQCAFVDVGLPRDVFLPLSDINFYESDFEHYDNPLDEDNFSAADSELYRNISITDVLKAGQEILVQVVKEAINNKGPRGTTFISLPGRYIVLMPSSQHVGISRRINDPVENARLQEIGLKIKPDNMGIIIRTVAAGRSEEELTHDLDFLCKLWSSIQKKQLSESTPSLIHQESSLLLKVVRDVFDDNTCELLIDSREEYEMVLNTFCFLPQELKERIHFTNSSSFSDYGVEEEIHSFLEKRVNLPSGGTIIIEETEALVSIDVNTGSYIGRDNLEETVYKTNLEAAAEIIRQLRIRNLGGIIVIDFIDMTEQQHRDELYQLLLKEAAKDKTRYNIFPVSDLGIVQLTRQRQGNSIATFLLNPCPYCKGKGRLHSKTFLSDKIYRELNRFCYSKPISNVLLVTCHPEIAAYLLEAEEGKLKKLEKETNVTIFIRGDSSFHFEQFKFSDGNAKTL